jgi:acetylornithine deacetylase/succinyl-diaminopimelate desuccinylase-like protein
MATLVQALDTRFRKLLITLGGDDKWLGVSSVNLGMIRGGTRSNIVADHCTLRVDMRTTPGLNDNGGALKALVDFVQDIDPSATISPMPETYPLNTDAENPFVQQLIRCGADLTGAPWFCDAAFLAFAGTPAIAIGPGSIAQAHTKDEFIAIQDLLDGASFFQRFIAQLSNFSKIQSPSPLVKA